MENVNYGLILENPLKMSTVRASMVLLENLVTKEGFHILFHRPETVLSPTLKFEDGNERILDVYELISGDGKKYSFFIDIYNDENLWIPPNGFLLEFDLLYYEDDGEEIEVKIDPAYVFDCEQIGLDIFDYYERNKKYEIEKILNGSMGVNYKVKNFPESLIERIKSEKSR
ncbi:MAG: hypothetical protein VB066_02205 [Paludibacter sp.]|jgi:hypothetical protein|nr:hypothetical protein [Paludibacter sp.]